MSDWRARIASWWKAKLPRERFVLAVALGALAVALVWIAAWEPLARDLARIQSERTRVARELAQGHAEAEGVARLARDPLPEAVEPRTAVDRALDRSGMRTAVTALQWRDRSAQLTLASVDFRDLVSWLEQAHRQDGLVLREARLTALVQPGMVRAELVLSP